MNTISPLQQRRTIHAAVLSVRSLASAVLAAAVKGYRAVARPLRGGGRVQGEGAGLGADAARHTLLFASLYTKFLSIP